MTDTDRMVVWLREAMGAATQQAEAAATETGSAEWEYQDHDNRLVATSPPRFTVADVDYLDPAPGKFMADNDPAAVLRRIAADRKMLDEHTPVPDHGRFSHSYGEKCPAFCAGECRDNPKVCLTCRDSSGDPIEAPCRSLEFLAEGWGWTGPPPKPDWPECMCTPTGECGRCWEKRQGAPNANVIEGGS